MKLLFWAVIANTVLNSLSVLHQYLAQKEVYNVLHGQIDHDAKPLQKSVLYMSLCAITGARFARYSKHSNQTNWRDTYLPLNPT
jgi:hypothetical protein